MPEPTTTEYAEMIRTVREHAESDAENDWLTYLSLDDAEYPEPDLSGEWADGWTPRRLAQAAGLYHTAGAAEYEYDENDYAERLNELCDEYEDAYRTRIALLGGN